MCYWRRRETEEANTVKSIKLAIHVVDVAGAVGGGERTKEAEGDQDELVIHLLILQVLLKEERELKKLMQKEKKRAQAEEAAKTAAKE